MDRPEGPEVVIKLVFLKRAIDNMHCSKNEVKIGIPESATYRRILAMHVFRETTTIYGSEASNISTTRVMHVLVAIDLFHRSRLADLGSAMFSRCQLYFTDLLKRCRTLGSFDRRPPLKTGGIQYHLREYVRVVARHDHGT